MTLYGIYGSSGCGRGVMPLARSQLAGQPGHRLVFIDDRPQANWVNGHQVLTFEQFSAVPAGMRNVALGIADPNVRKRLARRCETAGFSFFEVRSSQSVQMDEVRVGEGALISPFVTFTSNIVIGRHFHANLYSYVEHDCVIGDFVTFAPGVQCNGNVHVGDGAYIGAGAVIRQGRSGDPLRIGTEATIGMGAVVTKDVPAGATVVGNPARLISR